MLYICKKRKGTNGVEYGVMDTDDGKVDYYDPKYLIGVVKKFHIDIQGIIYDQGKFRFTVLEPSRFNIADVGEDISATDAGVEVNLLDEMPDVNTDSVAYKFDDKYLIISDTNECYDYTVLDSNYHEIDGGQLDFDDSITITARDIMRDFCPSPKILERLDYDEVVERFEAADAVVPNSSSRSNSVDNTMSYNELVHHWANMSTADFQAGTAKLKDKILTALEQLGIPETIIEALTAQDLELIDGVDCVGYEVITFGDVGKFSIYVNPNHDLNSLDASGFGIDLFPNNKSKFDQDDLHFDSGFDNVIKNVGEWKSFAQFFCESGAGFRWLCDYWRKMSEGEFLKRTESLRNKIKKALRELGITDGEIFSITDTVPLFFDVIDCIGYEGLRLKNYSHASLFVNPAHSTVSLDADSFGMDIDDIEEPFISNFNNIQESIRSWSIGRDTSYFID